MAAAEARPHHYNFAHTQLRRAAREAPGELMRVLASPGARTYLITLWNAIGDSLPEEYRVAAAGLRVRVVDLDARRRLATVVLPPPEAAMEAYMVGIVHEARGRMLGVIPRRPHVRYFTLERVEGEVRTALWEWRTQQGDRVRHECHPAPSEQAFRETIEQRLAAT